MESVVAIGPLARESSRCERGQSILARPPAARARFPSASWFGPVGLAAFQADLAGLGFQGTWSKRTLRFRFGALTLDSRRRGGATTGHGAFASGLLPPPEAIEDTR